MEIYNTDNGQSEQPVIIRGLVIPAEWDAQGQVLRVAISAFDDNEYLVEIGPFAAELLGLLRQEVEVTARVKTINEGLKAIEVENYKLKNKERAFTRQP